MASMIESLLGTTAERKDGARYAPIRRMAPSRPRELLEIIGELGLDAKMQNLLEVINWRNADPRQVTFAVLGRLPMPSELARIPNPYKARRHAQTLLSSPEFRVRLRRRLIEAYPEKQRLLFVHVPRCAGQLIIERLDKLHPALTDELADEDKISAEDLIVRLGDIIGRIRNVRTIQVATRQPLASFLRSPAIRSPQNAAPIAAWEVDSAAYRLGDLLYTVIREPMALMLSHINDTIAKLRAGESLPKPLAEALSNNKLPSKDDVAGWQAFASEAIAALSLRNPICTALGQGTAASAASQCRICDLDIAILDNFDKWMEQAWMLQPDQPASSATPIVNLADLDDAARAHVEAASAEDVAFYTRVLGAQARSDRYAVPGSLL